MTTNLPQNAVRAQRGSKNPLDAVEHDLNEVVFGQARAIEALVRAMNRARFGFGKGNKKRPRAVLMFIGPTGVGKTEIVKRLANRLHPDGKGFLKIDCSMIASGHEVATLVGAPPSYVGRDQKPLFDPDIIEQDNAIVLFDEIEKATGELWNMLLQIMEDGEITLLNGGRVASFRRAIIVLTSNVGAKEMQDDINKSGIGFRSTQRSTEARGKDIYDIGFKALKKLFRPEWLNRITEIIAFRPLSAETMGQIFDRMIHESNNDVYAAQGIWLRVSQEAKDYLIEKSFDPAFGARPLRNRLEKELDAPLADLLASGGIPHGAIVDVVYTGKQAFGEELDFYYTENVDLFERWQQRRIEERAQRQQASGQAQQQGGPVQPAASPEGPSPKLPPSRPPAAELTAEGQVSKKS